jgi:hypothetical protein
MTREDIIRMAREAGFDTESVGICAYEWFDIERFAALVAAASASVEREACAKVCDDLAVMALDPMVAHGSSEECAEAIRARSST